MDIKNSKTCQTCKRDFDLNKYVPLKLPCKHTFCKSCLEIRIKQQSILYCVYCGAPIIKSFDDLDQDQYIIDLLKSQNSINTDKIIPQNDGIQIKSKRKLTSYVLQLTDEPAAEIIIELMDQKKFDESLSKISIDKINQELNKLNINFDIRLHNSTKPDIRKSQHENNEYEKKISKDKMADSTEKYSNRDNLNAVNDDRNDDDKKSDMEIEEINNRANSSSSTETTKADVNMEQDGCTKVENHQYEDGIYKGCIVMKNNSKIRHGFGVFTWSNGNEYIGDWKEDRMEGVGSFYYANKSVYDGQFFNNMLHGKGTFFYNDGDVYVGGYKNNLKWGQGLYFFNNGPQKGDKYDGAFVSDKFHGNGVYYYRDGQHFESTWNNVDKKDMPGLNH